MTTLASSPLQSHSPLAEWAPRPRLRGPWTRSKRFGFALPARMRRRALDRGQDGSLRTRPGGLGAARASPEMFARTASNIGSGFLRSIRRQQRPNSLRGFAASPCVPGHQPPAPLTGPCCRDSVAGVHRGARLLQPAVGAGPARGRPLGHPRHSRNALHSRRRKRGPAGCAGARPPSAGARGEGLRP